VSHGSFLKIGPLKKYYLDMKRVRDVNKTNIREQLLNEAAERVKNYGFPAVGCYHLERERSVGNYKPKFIFTVATHIYTYLL